MVARVEMHKLPVVAMPTAALVVSVAMALQLAKGALVEQLRREVAAITLDSMAHQATRTQRCCPLQLDLTAAMVVRVVMRAPLESEATAGLAAWVALVALAVRVALAARQAKPVSAAMVARPCTPAWAP
jgi:hypothetical protein